MKIPLSLRTSGLARFLAAAAVIAISCAGSVPSRADNLPPKVAVLHPVRGEIFTNPADLHAFVEASDADGFVKSVEILAETGSLGMMTPDPASPGPSVMQWTWKNPPSGEHKLVARATDDAGVSTMSEPVVFFIRRDTAPNGARLVIVKPAIGERFAPGDRVAIGVVASDPEGEIRRVEFFVNDMSVGVSELAHEDVVVPGRRREHVCEWTPSAPGHYQIVARGSDTHGHAVESVPVAIAVVAPMPLVTIEATRPETSEPAPNIRVAPGVFTLKRNAVNLADPLKVFLAVFGTATPGVDYERLPEIVTFPGGVSEIELLVQPFEDFTVEGLETVVVSVGNELVAWAPEHAIDPQHARAQVLIRDADAATEPILEIHRPVDGEVFEIGRPLAIEATAIDPKGYTPRVEFYDFEKLLGVSEITFIRAPDPGTPIPHKLEWRNLAEGEHLLTARAHDANRNPVVSKPVRIEVKGQPDVWPKVRVETLDAEATEFPPEVDGIDAATFLISREDPDFGKDLTVYFVVYGTADAGVDYTHPGRSAVIPAGKRDVRVDIIPLPDDRSEPMETVALRLMDPRPLSSIPEPTEYLVDALSGEAAAVIFDRTRPETGALELALPRDGQTFHPWGPVRMVAAAYHPTLDVSHVDFYAGNDRIGFSEIAFLRPNGGGLIMHEFIWEKPFAGDHVITARARLPEGSELVSSPLRINVPGAPTSVVLDIVAVDLMAAEVGPDNLPDPAVFEIRRVGGPSDVAVTVWYKTDGSAMNGVDYRQLDGTIELPAGEDKVQLVVRPILDKALEGDESVIVALEPPVCITLFPPPPSCYAIAGGGMAKAIIQDDGLAPENLAEKAVVFDGIELQKDGAVRLRMNNQAGRPCVLEMSTDLLNWTEVAPGAFPDGVIEFRDEKAKANQQLFYRTRLP